MSTLIYRSGDVRLDTLGIGECTVHGASQYGKPEPRWWNLWFHVLEMNGSSLLACVPIIPGGAYTESGPGGRSWGLTKAGPGIWQVSPSINVLAKDNIVAGHVTTAPSRWHETPPDRPGTG